VASPAKSIVLTVVVPLLVTVIGERTLRSHLLPLTASEYVPAGTSVRLYAPEEESVMVWKSPPPRTCWRKIKTDRLLCVNHTLQSDRAGNCALCLNQQGKQGKNRKQKSQCVASNRREHYVPPLVLGQSRKMFPANLNALSLMVSADIMKSRICQKYE